MAGDLHLNVKETIGPKEALGAGEHGWSERADPPTFPPVFVVMASGWLMPGICSDKTAPTHTHGVKYFEPGLREGGPSVVRSDLFK